jgi:hypothetical protein
MRAVWLDAGNVPNPAVLAAHGVTRTVWPENVAYTTRELIDAWRDEYAQGIYSARNWYGFTPAEWADHVSERVHTLGGDARMLEVHFNVEPFDATYTTQLLLEWRRQRPYRDTVLIVEWNKGAILGPVVHLVKNDAHLVIAEENYTGLEMTPQDADVARCNLTGNGIPRSKAVVCYDAARLGAWWDGVAFTQGRLK